MNEERAPEYGGYSSEPATPLEILERIVASLPPGDPTRSEIIGLRSSVADRKKGFRRRGQRLKNWTKGSKKSITPANGSETNLAARNKKKPQTALCGAKNYTTLN